MHSETARSTRLLRTHFLNADLEAGFALLRATRESADRALESRQIEEARHALDRARTLRDRMHQQDAVPFARRLAALERATGSAG